MTIERCVELQDKLLCLENALRHYGMNAESKATFCILERLIYHRDKDDTKQAEQRCLEFWAKYKHVRNRFDREYVLICLFVLVCKAKLFCQLFHRKVLGNSLLARTSLHGVKYQSGGSQSEERFVFDNAAFSVAKNLCPHKGAGIAWAIAQNVFQTAILVITHIDIAMGEIHTGVNRLNRAVDGIAFLVSANGVLAKLEGDYLLVMKHILYHR